jgi:general secretion pathway protein D
MIETIIVEASLDSSSRLGIEWQDAHGKVFGSTGTSGTANQDFGLRPNNTLPQGFRYTLTGGALSAFMNALKTDTKFNVLSTPRIFTSNNVEAQINISQRVPFVVSQRADANGNITFNYDFEDVGIVLTVTPRITAGGYVTMDVNQTANDLQGFTSFNAPIVNQRQAQTTVAVRDGETIILGGIIRSTVSTTTKKIPLLGDIPILGNLFRSTDKSDQKTELLVFLTPRVVRDPAEAAKLTDEQRKKLSLPTQDQLNKSGAFGDKTNKSQTGGGN